MVSSCILKLKATCRLPVVAVASVNSNSRSFRFIMPARSAFPPVRIITDLSSSPLGRMLVACHVPANATAISFSATSSPLMNSVPARSSTVHFPVSLPGSFPSAATLMIPLFPSRSMSTSMVTLFFSTLMRSSWVSSPFSSLVLVPVSWSPSLRIVQVMFISPDSEVATTFHTPVMSTGFSWWSE